MSILKKTMALVCCLCTAFSMTGCFAGGTGISSSSSSSSSSAGGTSSSSSVGGGNSSDNGASDGTSVDGGNSDSQSSAESMVDTTLTGELNIRVWDGGYGLRWLDNVIVAFNDRYPNVDIEVSDSVERQQVFGDIVGKGTKYDIIFSESIVTDYAEECLEPIDDVYAYTNAGESLSVGEKIMPIYIKYLNNKGHYYSIPSYVGAYGIVYNGDYIYDDEIPVTTDELKALCTELKSSIKPFIFSGETGTNYWDYIYSTWFAQYEGRNAYSAALSGQIIDANGEYKYDPKSTYMDGSLKAMQVCEDLLWYENGNIVTASTALQFITAQRNFLQGGAAMMYNGSWLFNEMELMFPNGPESDFKMMKVPVISAIIEKCTTIANDAELSALVKAIDAGETALKGDGYDVNEVDFAKVAEARNFFYAGSEGATGVIPINSPNKDLAKRFLAFMYSEEAIEAHALAKAGNILPVNNFNVNIPADNTFMETAYNILLNNEVFFNNPVIAIPPTCEAINAGGIEKQFGSKNSKDRTRAVDSFNAKKELWTKNDNEKFWNTLISMGYIKEKP